MKSEEIALGGRKKINLEVISPEGGFHSKGVDYVELPGSLGRMGVLPNHASMISVLVPGIIEYRTSEETKKISSGPGTAKIDDNRMLILLKHFEAIS